MKTAAAIFILICLSVEIFPQSAADSYTKIRRSIDENDHGTAVTELRRFETENPAVFAINNLDYLFGRLLEESGDAAGAMRRFESVRARNSILKNYALLHLAALSRSTGNLFLERIYLSEINSFASGSLPSIAARSRIAESYLDSGDYPAAIRLLSENPSESGKATRGSLPAFAIDKERKQLVLLAKANMLAGSVNEAETIFERVLQSTPNAAQPDDHALAAVIGLDTIDAASGDASQLSDAEHFRRAAVFRFNREFEKARAHYIAVVNGTTAGTLMQMAVFETGRTYSQEGNFVEAVKWFERDQEQAVDSGAAKDSLLQAASAYARLGKNREAITRYQKYIELYRDDEKVDRAYLNIIDAHRDDGEETAAIQWAQTTQQVFRGKLPEALALFSESRIYIARDDWANALAALERLRSFSDLGANVPGGTDLVEISFLRAYSFERLGQFSETIDAYLAIPDGRGEYYGWRSTERLNGLASDPVSKAFVDAKLASLVQSAVQRDAEQSRSSAIAALRLSPAPEIREKLLDILERAYSRTPTSNKNAEIRLLESGRTQLLLSERPAIAPTHKVIADELIFLRLFDEAAPEFEASLALPASANPRMPVEAAYTLAVLYARGDRGDRAAGYADRIWNMPDNFGIEMIDPRQARFVYPAPYKRELLANASSRGVDPRFLLSIIRQESGFRPNVKSNAAARGLMQFISTTATTTARELGQADFRNDDLYDPETSIVFGSRYTQKLFTIFPDLPDAVTAAYNGGEDNMKRWLARSKSRRPEQYVSEIAFSQSKDYVYRVMNNYRMYRRLYDENLNPKNE